MPVKDLTGQTFTYLLSASGNPLRFDFALFDDDHKLIALIEHQGEQHYLQIPFGRIQREITDKQKKEYCSKRSIPLFKIRYDENIPSAIRNILIEINYLCKPTPCQAQSTDCEGVTTISKESSE